MSRPNIKLIGTNVLVLPIKVRRSAGGINYSDRYQDDEMQWRVIAVGPGRIVRKKGKEPVLIPCEVKPGDRIITPLIHGNKLAIKTSGALIIEYEEIIAVISENNEA